MRHEIKLRLTGTTPAGLFKVSHNNIHNNIHNNRGVDTFAVNQFIKNNVSVTLCLLLKNRYLYEWARYGKGNYFMARPRRLAKV